MTYVAVSKNVSQESKIGSSRAPAVMVLINCYGSELAIYYL